jgi:pheromone a factor receptor
MHPELAFGAFLASALVLVPLPWHWRARNTTTLSMLTWLFVSNITYAINAVIWSGHIDEVVPVWCDIGLSTLLLLKVALMERPRQ